MRDRSAQTDSVRRDLLQGRKLAPYEALDISWVAIIKLANLFSENDEHQRLLTLLDRLPAESAAKILELPAVYVLLNLEPPLETVLSALTSTSTRNAQLESWLRLERIEQTLRK